jgi:predicted TIM-barrel enzyme
MVKRFEREEIINRFREEVKKGRAIFDSYAGTGISAKFADLAGVDMITTHILSRFRMMGLSSMVGYFCFSDANAVILELGRRDILPVVKKTPVMMGVFGIDPTRNMEYFLNDVINVGFSGVCNAPTIALVDGNFRKALEETGVSFSQEVDMIGIAHRKGLYTKALCATPEEALQMIGVGCDNIIAHGGNTAGGSIGSKTVASLDDMVNIIQNILDAVKRKKPDVLVTCHGGAAVTPEDVQYLLNKVKGLEGYVGGSTAERIPVETALMKANKTFKELHIPGKK